MLMPERAGSILIEAVAPSAGGSPVKRVVGERLLLEADIFKDGHDVLSAVARPARRSPSKDAVTLAPVPLTALGNDRWRAELTFPSPGRYALTIEAWVDGYRTWVSELERKLEAGRNVQSEILEGIALLKGAASRAKQAGDPAGPLLDEAARGMGGDPRVAAERAMKPEVVAAASRWADLSLANRLEDALEVHVERERARSGAWYEFFPRSLGTRGHGTFKDAEEHLPYVASLGFDVVYLPPIHPIGRTGRKGKNNSVTALPEDVGSPWAIGAAEGGHTAIHPELGTLADFRRFVSRAITLDLEVAIDLAFQCSPDHPYVREHREWFFHRPDGTLKTAENPPKRYEDIVNLDWMGPARGELWSELLRVTLFWVDQGVRIFRVDNPHTKPVAFWRWLISEVHERHPNVVFLSEAFTRPRPMAALAKAGFSQSYSYFTWRTTKRELTDYLTELTQGPAAEYLRANLWPNTPDILPKGLQGEGPPAFMQRLALAATLSPSYGIYSGFELCEGNALPNSEEYRDSEKYQLVKRDLAAPGGIQAFVAALNRLRREQPALRLYRNLRFYECDNDAVLFYGKLPEDGGAPLLFALSLDPHGPQTATLHLPEELLGSPGSLTVVELLTGERRLWPTSTPTVTLRPEAPLAVFQGQGPIRSEKDFDYYD
jgi:starch synthase (maltosyl-transferring)